MSEKGADLPKTEVKDLGKTKEEKPKTEKEVAACVYVGKEVSLCKCN